MHGRNGDRGAELGQRCFLRSRGLPSVPTCCLHCGPRDQLPGEPRQRPCLLRAAELKDTKTRAEPNVSAWSCHLCWCWFGGGRRDESAFSFSAFHFLFARERWALFSAQLIVTTFCRVMSALTPHTGLQTLQGHRVRQTKQHIHSIKNKKIHIN